MNAVDALGKIWADAKSAVPHIAKMLKHKYMRELAASDLERIATALQHRQDTTAIPDLEMVLAALRAAKLLEAPTVQHAVNVLRAIEKDPHSLRTINVITQRVGISLQIASLPGPGCS